MKSISKLKNEARRHELTEDWEKAINAYLEVLRVAEKGEGDVELPLYNRIGDLYVRLGRAREGVGFYEQAADRYADAGLYNNAIALCNKALRYNPDQSDLFLKLGRFSASQGFVSDARRYFIEYADRKFRLGKEEEAFGGLEELARSSDDASIWELLGRRLIEKDRIERGVRELQRAYALRLGAGEEAQAEALRQEILAVAPDARLDDHGGSATPGEDADSDAFIGVDGGSLEPLPLYEAAGRDRGDRDDEVPTSQAVEGFEATALEEAVPEDVAMLDVPELEERAHAAAEEAAEAHGSSPLAGLEATSADFAAAAAELAEAESDLDIERDEPFAADELPADVAEQDGSEGDAGGTYDGEAVSPLPLPSLEEDEAFRAAAYAVGAEPAEDALAGLPLLDDEEYDEDEDEAEPVDPAAAFAGMPSLESAPSGEAETGAADSGAEEPAGAAFIDLAALLTEDVEDTTRFRIQEAQPTGDEDHDFAELLSQFKAKLSEHLSPEDAAAHYDLGLAFKEMGLIDEAISSFQVALRAGDMRLKIFEELGQCFLEKSHYNIAEKVLRRALDLSYDDELELLGVYYYLGRACEELRRPDQARDAYERVLGMDIGFRDVAERLARL
jgi:tetratricopeptide (TPR) repeat protein